MTNCASWASSSHRLTTPGIPKSGLIQSKSEILHPCREAIPLLRGTRSALADACLFAECKNWGCELSHGVSERAVGHRPNRSSWLPGIGGGLPVLSPGSFLRRVGPESLFLLPLCWVMTVSSRALTSSNSEVDTRYSVLLGRIFWISSSEAIMRSPVGGWSANTLAMLPGLRRSSSITLPKKPTKALGSYPALYMYWRPRKSASGSSFRLNFRKASGTPFI